MSIWHRKRPILWTPEIPTSYHEDDLPKYYCTQNVIHLYNVSRVLRL